MKVKSPIFLVFVLTCVFAQQQISEFMEETTMVCKNEKSKTFKKITLAYVTPWNPTGYKLALDNANKIDILSPCWFQLMPEKLNGKFNTKVNYLLNRLKEVIILILISYKKSKRVTKKSKSRQDLTAKIST